jgi:hypothetical protein
VINTISFSYPWWFIFFCFLLGSGYAVLMYHKDGRFVESGNWLIRLLAFLRGFSVFIISLLLLSPFIKTIKEDIKPPLIVIASDNSESLKGKQSPGELLSWQKDINALAGELTGKYEVRQISFGSQVYPEKNDTLNDKSTNISNAIKYIKDNFGDQNLGAVIVSTDGIYNEGSNPLYSEGMFKAPLYTIALGDTTQKKDILIQNVLHNKIAYLGDKFPVQVDISSFNGEGSSTKLTLEVIKGNQVTKVGEENISIASKSFYTSKTFLVDASQTGVVRYRLRISGIAGEFNTVNNTKEFFVEVLDARQKVLLIGNAPHPDLSALKSIITSNKNYEAEIAFAGEMSGDVSRYNLIILHNLPSESKDISGLMSQINRSNIPVIFIVGMQTSLARFNQSQNVVSINGNAKNNEDIQAEFNASFSLFTTSDYLKSKIKIFPPLIAPFGEYKSQGTATVYLYQTIKKIKTNYPMVAFNDQNGIKTAVLIGEGLWKWRLFDYLQNKNYDIVTELVNKIVLLTTVKTDKRKFRANTSKNIYKDNEQIMFDAQLYNDSYEMVNDPDVRLVIKDESGKEYKYNFNKTQNYYTLNADLFPNGSYSYTASVVYNGKDLTASGRFNVESLQLEQYDLTARHGLLRSLAEKYGGTMVYPDKILSLKDVLLNNENIKPVLYESKTTKSIISLKWIFFFILFLLTLEWFLRRYFGNY